MANYKIWTFGKNGNRILLAKIDDNMAARNVMEALCDHYPKWKLELDQVHGDRDSERVAWRDGDDEHIKRFICATDGSVCPYKPDSFEKWPCKTCERSTYDKKR